MFMQRPLCLYSLFYVKTGQICSANHMILHLASQTCYINKLLHNKIINDYTILKEI